MAELEKSLTAAGFASSRSIALTDVHDLTSAATTSQSQENATFQEVAKKGKKTKKKAESGSKTIEKQDLLKSLLERLTKGGIFIQTLSWLNPPCLLFHAHYQDYEGPITAS